MKRIIVFLLLFISASMVAVNKDKRTLVLLQTSMGKIYVELYNETPLHRDNFVKKVKNGFYNGLLFHRVIQNFMIQGGDPTSKGAAKGVSLGEGSAGETIAPEFKYPKFFHRRGALVMAREGDDVNPEKRSSDCQFYIVWGKLFNDENLANVQKRLDERTNGLVKMDSVIVGYYKRVGGTPYLDGSYTVFGEVVAGLDVVGRIQSVMTDSNNRPLKDIKIIKAKIVKKIEY